MYQRLREADDSGREAGGGSEVEGRTLHNEFTVLSKASMTRQ